MQQLNDVDLSQKTTMHIGGLAKNFYLPESASDIIALIEELERQKTEYYILSGGSNLLINDEKEYPAVISMSLADRSLEVLEEGRFYIGASNRIQKVIQFVNDHGCGGFEELIGLPAFFGGIVYMNAGIGGRKTTLFTIGDFIDRVRVIERSSQQEKWIPREACAFGHRSSVFQSDRFIILGAEITLKNQDKAVSQERIEKRRDYCRTHQEWAKGCFGSCFIDYSKGIMAVFSKLNIHRGGVRQSGNNPNWLINDGTGCYKDAIWLIDMMIKTHRLLRKSISPEIRIWR